MLCHCSVTQQRVIPVRDPISPLTGSLLCIFREEACLLILSQVTALQLFWGGIPYINGFVSQGAMLAIPAALAQIPKTGGADGFLPQESLLVLPQGPIGPGWLGSQFGSTISVPLITTSTFSVSVTSATWTISTPAILVISTSTTLAIATSTILVISTSTTLAIATSATRGPAPTTTASASGEGPASAGGSASTSGGGWGWCLKSSKGGEGFSLVIVVIQAVSALLNLIQGKPVLVCNRVHDQL